MTQPKANAATPRSMASLATLKDLGLMPAHGDEPHTAVIEISKEKLTHDQYAALHRSLEAHYPARVVELLDHKIIIASPAGVKIDLADVTHALRKNIDRAMSNPRSIKLRPRENTDNQSLAIGTPSLAKTFSNAMLTYIEQDEAEKWAKKTAAQPNPLSSRHPRGAASYHTLEK